MTHGCSPFAVTRRNLTPLDIVTAHSILPGRDDVALLLEEAMRGEGWTGGKMEEKRRLFEERRRRREKQMVVRDNVGKTLGVNPKWWGDSDFSSSDSESGDEDADESVYVRASISIPKPGLISPTTDPSRRLLVDACIFATVSAPDIRVSHY
jgi:hypothetical protein